MKKEKAILYDQDLKTKDIFLYLPDSVKRKLTSKDKKGLEKALYLVVMEYKKRYDEKYLDRMLI